MIGHTLGHFEIVDKLGEGGMGVVYKAHDTHLDRLVAIKILHADKVADRDRRQRFVQEADQLQEFAVRTNSDMPCVAK